MSTSSPAPSSGGDDAYAYFFTTGIPETVATLVSIQKLASAEGWTRVLDEATRIGIDLLTEVNQEGRLAAAFADAAIVRVLIESRSRNRPSRDLLESHVRSEALPLGGVAVGLLDELDKAVNPDTGYGTFWRAQEYGTGTAEVPTQVGRVFHGVFQPTGTAPDHTQQGNGRGSDLVFTSASSSDGGGFGTISVELPGRHFLRDGSAEAGKLYQDAMAKLQDRYVQRVKGLLVLAKSEATRTIRYVLDA